MGRWGDNIYRRKDGRWEGRYIAMRLPDGKAKYRSVYGRNRTIVKKKLVAAIQALPKESVSSCSLTVKELFAQYLAQADMLIKIVQNGIESDWFQLTKKAHRELIKKKPEAAVIHIEDIYPESPDAGRVIQLDFRLFTVLTREFKLEDLKQEKRDERHVEKLRLEARPANAPELVSTTLDEQYTRQEINELLESAPALAGLTPTQLRRFQLFVESGKSFREIAEIEHCKYSTVKDSVDAAKKKIKKFFKSDRSKREFLSD